jgi:dihydrofolate synthase/folylpolyglutamate synthase
LKKRTLAEWLELQQSVHVRGIDLELSRVARVASRLGVDRPHCPVVTVGGTNGKGSVVAFLEALALASGINPGVFTSPHLVRYNERIRIGGAEATDDELIEAFERIESARAETTLTYFEYNTLAALLVFAARRTDLMILEVGLGGRLDSTNIVDSDVAVVCSIGLDHRDWLGDTLEAIGREKAGIFRRGRPAVLGSADMPRSVFDSIEACGAIPVVAERDFHWEVREGDAPATPRWYFRGLQVALADLPAPSLHGSIQYRNAATALAAAERLPARAGLRFDNVAQALRSAFLPGRFQIVPGPVEWILDVAHNEPAALVLAAHLKERPCEGRTVAVISILGDKDATAIGRALDPVVDHWIICSLSEPRGLSAAQVRARLPVEDSKVTLAGSVAEGCEHARSIARPGDRVVACGSFLVVSAALQWLRLY